jgi:hypothetical protein
MAQNVSSNPRSGIQSSEVLEASNRAMVHLMGTNTFCRDDNRCERLCGTLATVQTEADVLTALTQTQALLTSLTAEDADVAGDSEVQDFRRQLHMLLDHRHAGV